MLSALVFRDPPLDGQFLYDMLGPLFKDLGKFLRRVPGYAFCYETLEKERPCLVRAVELALKCVGRLVTFFFFFFRWAC